MDDFPVGVLQPGALYNVNPDHLGAPLTVTNATGQIIWRWDRDHYGKCEIQELEHLRTICDSLVSIMTKRLSFIITTSGIIIRRREDIYRLIRLG
ncbi:RHS domain-containing protein [Solidesulfovibrio aerotolerans]|uniref:RHS domain-containing protein n=1 Tax=Solidesulfovibrio aerotolerans TaxID=295255 RepID=UPI001BAC6677